MNSAIRVPMVNLRAQYAEIREEIHAALDRVLASQRFILGEEVAQFEDEFAKFLGVDHAVGVSSGTDALIAALMALDLAEGDEVVTTPFTFLSTVEAIVRAGGRPVLVDLAPGQFAPSPAALAKAITARTRAILPVHLFGGCEDLAELAELSRARGVALIEDAAQAIGSSCKGRRAGSFGDMAAFSFFPTKNLGAYGDAGAVVTSDPGMAKRLRQIRNHGQTTKYTTVHLGGNFRLDELQAAVLRVKLRHLDRWSARRRTLAARYVAQLTCVSSLDLPTPANDEVHVFNQFTLRTSRRQELRAHLERAGIGTEVYYPSPMHRQGAWSCAGAFPLADRMCNEVLSIPLYPELSEREIDLVASEIRRFFAEG